MVFPRIYYSVQITIRRASVPSRLEESVLPKGAPQYVLYVLMYLVEGTIQLR